MTMSSLSLPPPKRSKQTTLLEIFRGASSHESDADNEDEPDADRLSEPDRGRSYSVLQTMQNHRRLSLLRRRWCLR